MQIFFYVFTILLILLLLLLLLLMATGCVWSVEHVSLLLFVYWFLCTCTCTYTSITRTMLFVRLHTECWSYQSWTNTADWVKSFRFEYIFDMVLIELFAMKTGYSYSIWNMHHNFGTGEKMNATKKRRKEMHDGLSFIAASHFMMLEMLPWKLYENFFCERGNASIVKWM